jgi:hypothetical protein
MKKKLVLHRETLQNLSTSMLGRVVRGATSGAEGCAATLASICQVFSVYGCGVSNGDCPGPHTDEVTICVCEI